MTCRRCGETTVRYTLSQRYCAPCERDVAERLRPRPEPAWMPQWRRVSRAKDLTGSAA